MSLPSPAAPPFAPDAPLFVVVNAGSGRDDGSVASETVQWVLGEAGREHVLFRVRDPEQLDATVAAAVQAAQAQGGAVVAAGGDGTLNAVAAQVIGLGLPYGVLPQGTFNLFGREHGLSQDVATAARQLLRATPAPVQVGRVNGRLFLVNASLGLYPELLEDREALREHFGGSRAAAIVTGLRTILSERVQLDLDVETQGERRRVRTPTLFVGNNALQLRRLGIDDVAAGEGVLAAVVVRPIGTWAMAGLALRGALGRLGDADNVHRFGFRKLTVVPRGRRRLKVAMDGEVTFMDAPLVFDIAPEPLYLLRPAPEDRVQEP